MIPAAQLAKATLRRIAVGQLEPTPENYARAWAQEAGTAAPATEPATGSATQWATLIERLVRGCERGGKVWTAARKKDSLQRVLGSSRSDMQRLYERLCQLAGHWDSDSEAAAGDTLNAQATRPAPLDAAPAAVPSAAVNANANVHHDADEAHWRGVVQSLEGTVRSALPGDDERARELADRLAALAARIDGEGANAGLVQSVDACCADARRLLGQRHQLVIQLASLARELTASIAELAEDESWAQGQAQAMQARLGLEAGGAGEGLLSVRGVRAAQDLLAQTRRQQLALKSERDRAHEALKGLVHSLMNELAQLGGQSGSFSEKLGRHAEAIEKSDSVGGLAALVREMVQDSRAMQSEVASASTRLQAGQAEAAALSSRVRELEGELRRLSEEVAVDALTQVANRRGLAQAFESERARHERSGETLAVALIDIDNFKKLNDSLGHSAGDAALKSLAARVRAALRPVDHVARFGGEEFVMLLPATPIAEAQQALTRLQRDLTASLFMHEGREVFITFSGGVTAWRVGEALDKAIERADEALYEAKRAGKNRTCVA
jgi:diguanylate cyclase